MSGFDKSWLALREPADKKARSCDLIDRLSEYLATKAGQTVLDIGCGTGSTWRSLAPCVPADTSWQLLDYDPRLLDEARHQIGNRTNVRFTRFDLNALDDLPLEGVALVTASAFFDLCSADFCNRFVNRLDQAGAGLYAALNYDGVMRWSETHPLDVQVTADFNRHQRTDKGFGPALGPDATAHLEAALENVGYDVNIRSSPWVLGPSEAALQLELLKGIEGPLEEIGTLSSEDIAEWLTFRIAAIERQSGSCVVGHTDILALRNP